MYIADCQPNMSEIEQTPWDNFQLDWGYEGESQNCKYTVKLTGYIISI